jgi:hypothetical protein
MNRIASLDPANVYSAGADDSEASVGSVQPPVTGSNTMVLGLRSRTFPVSLTQPSTADRYASPSTRIAYVAAIDG